MPKSISQKSSQREKDLLTVTMATVTIEIIWERHVDVFGSVLATEALTFPVLFFVYFIFIVSPLFFP